MNSYQPSTGPIVADSADPGDLETHEDDDPDIGQIEPEWNDAAEMAADDARYDRRYS